MASTAAGQAAARGISEASTANPASADSSNTIAPKRRDGFHSMRQVEDPADERGELGIGDVFIAHEPAPELIVLAFQQP